MKSVDNFFKSLLGFVPPEMREFVGFMLGMFIVILIPIFMVTAAMKLPSLMEKKCWEIHESGGKIYKLNACTGSLSELTPATP